MICQRSWFLLIFVTLTVIFGRSQDPVSAQQTSSSIKAVDWLSEQPNYKLMAEALNSSNLKARLDTLGKFTVLAIDDESLRKVIRSEMSREERKSNSKLGAAKVAGYCQRHLILKGVWPTNRIETANWLLLLDGFGGYSEWKVINSGGQIGLMNLTNDGLPSIESKLVKKDIMTSDSVIHCLDGIKRFGIMTRGGKIEPRVCLEMIESAIQRMELRLAENQAEIASEIGFRVLSNLQYDIQLTLRVLEAMSKNAEVTGTANNITLSVPARVFVVLMTGLARCLDIEDGDAKAGIYLESLKSAKFLLSEDNIREVNEGSDIRDLSAQIESYREAEDLARFVLRSQGLSDKAWRRKRK